MPGPQRALDRHFWIAALILVLVGATWRGIQLAQMPCISRDGVNFCWFARDLGREGLAALQAGRYEQHPLYPLAILGTQRAMLASGWRDEPMTWQRAGQLVSWGSGVAVVALAGAVTLRLARRTSVRTDGPAAALLGMLFAALLDRNVWLSADVMSDELHLAFYLGAVFVFLRMEHAGHAGLCGALAGLAFVTRPEGAVLLVGAGAVLMSGSRGRPLAAVLARGAALLAGFVLVAGPYFVASGDFSPKLEKEGIEEFRPQPAAQVLESARETPAVAALFREELPWHGAVLRALEQTFRAGRVVVPLLALVALWRRRRTWFSSPLIGVLLCVGVHFTLTAYLQYRHGYLDPRHTLPAVMLLVPLAAVALRSLFETQWARGRRRLAAGLLLVVYGPLGLYAVRVPNAADAFLFAAGQRLAPLTRDSGGGVLLGGSSERRLAFYAGLEFRPWPENEPDPHRRLAEARAYLVGGKPDYFAMETGPGREREGNAELLAALRRDSEVAAAMQERIVETTERGDSIHVWSFAWPADAPAEKNVHPPTTAPVEYRGG